MTDAMTRRLERAAAQGDDEARLALGAQRVREGRCPACGAGGPGRSPEKGNDNWCCCWDCWDALALNSTCASCPPKHIDDEQSKEDK